MEWHKRARRSRSTDDATAKWTRRFGLVSICGCPERNPGSARRDRLAGMRRRGTGLSGALLSSPSTRGPPRAPYRNLRVSDLNRAPLRGA